MQNENLSLFFRSAKNIPDRKARYSVLANADCATIEKNTGFYHDMDHNRRSTRRIDNYISDLSADAKEKSDSLFNEKFWRYSESDLSGVRS